MKTDKASRQQANKQCSRETSTKQKRIK